MTIDEERNIIAAAKAGDEQAAQTLYDAYMPLMKHAAATVNKRGKYFLYDDALSTAYLAFWRSVLEFDDSRGANFAAYVKLRVVGAVKDFLRAEKSDNDLPLESAADQCVFMDEAPLDLPDFTAREKDILTLLQSGFKEREIAAFVACSQQAVSKAKTRLFRKLRRHFSKEESVYLRC